MTIRNLSVTPQTSEIKRKRKDPIEGYKPIIGSFCLFVFEKTPSRECLFE
mgnify:CR=1 FL=1